MKISGTITALVTPFAKDGSVDYGCLKSLVEAQTAAGVEGICSAGTSGESPTLSFEEHHRVIEKTIEYAAGKCLVIAGTGANSTSEAVSLTKAAIAMGGQVAGASGPAGHDFYGQAQAAGHTCHQATCQPSTRDGTPHWVAILPPA